MPKLRYPETVKVGTIGRRWIVISGDMSLLILLVGRILVSVLCAVGFRVYG